MRPLLSYELHDWFVSLQNSPQCLRWKKREMIMWFINFLLMTRYSFVHGLGLYGDDNARRWKQQGEHISRIWVVIRSQSLLVWLFLQRTAKTTLDYYWVWWSCVYISSCHPIKSIYPMIFFHINQRISGPTVSSKLWVTPRATVREQDQKSFKGRDESESDRARMRVAT